MVRAKIAKRSRIERASAILAAMATDSVRIKPHAFAAIRTFWLVCQHATYT